MSQTDQKSARFGVGIEVPDASAVKNGVLNAAADPGHTAGYFKDENGKIVRTMSFGPGEPIGATNKDAFKSENISGNAEWPLSGNLATWEANISPKQLATGLSELAKFNANPPNYAPAMQCTSAVLGLASRIGVNLPSGVGPVVARAYGVTALSGNLPNPSVLSQQMTRAFGSPMIAPASSFPSLSGGSKWW